MMPTATLKLETLAALNAASICLTNRDQSVLEMKTLEAIKVVMAKLEDVKLPSAIFVNDLIDLASNVAGFDDTWFVNASEASLRGALLEYRDQARKALDVREPAL